MELLTQKSNMAKKRKYLTDAEAGIRTITQIENLPVKELTDTEICKLFLVRFEANALVMCYTDQAGGEHFFGRLRTENSYRATYRRLLEVINQLDIPGSIQFVEEDENLKS